MPSTYTLNNGIELIGTGEQSGTWGDTTNTNLELLDSALDGQVTVTLTSAGTSGSPNDLPISDGAASDGRNRMIIFNDGGDLGATAYVQLTPNDAEKIIYVRNDLSGSRSIILFQGTYSASNDYEVPAGTTAVVYFNGAGSGAVAANVFNNAYFDSLRLGSVSVTAILDEDNMASDSATALATQQSIKAYVDTQVGANNELSEVLANGNTTGGTDIAVSTGDDITFADSSKAIFGTGSDLRIYHDGANSYVEDNGVGNLNLKTNGAAVSILDASGYQLANFNSTSGEALLKHVSAGVSTTRLNTTSTGINVTGEVEADTAHFGTGTGTGPNVADEVVVSGTGSTGLTIHSPDTSNATLAFGSATDNDYAFLQGYYNSGSPFIRASIQNSEVVKITNTGINVTGTVTLDDTLSIDSLTTNGFIQASNNVFQIGTSSNDRVDFYANNTAHMSLAGDGEFIVNESGNAEGDVRVESDSNTHMLFIDAGNNSVAINSNNPSANEFRVATTANFVTSTGTNPVYITRTGGTDQALSIFTDDTNSYIDAKQDEADISYGGLFFRSTNGINTTRKLLYLNQQNSVFNDDGADIDFRVESVNNTHMLFVNAGTDNVGINRSSVGATLDVGGDIRAIQTGGGVVAKSRVSTDNQTDAIVSARTTDTNGTRTGFMANGYPDASYSETISRDDTDFSAVGWQFYTLNSTYETQTRATLKLELTDNTEYNLMTANYGNVIFNEGGEDIDFRVESDTNTHALFVDAGSGHVNIQNSSDLGATFNVAGDTFITGAGASISYPTYARFVVEGGGANTDRWGDGSKATVAIRSKEMTLNEWFPTLHITTIRQSLTTGFNATGGIGFTTIDDSNAQGIDDAARIEIYNTSGGSRNSPTGIQFYTNTGGTVSNAAQGVLKLDNTSTVFNEGSYDTDFRVESNGQTHALFVDSSTDRVGIFTGSPTHDVHVPYVPVRHGNMTNWSGTLPQLANNASASITLSSFGNYSSALLELWIAYRRNGGSDPATAKVLISLYNGNASFDDITIIDFSGATIVQGDITTSSSGAALTISIENTNWFSGSTAVAGNFYLKAFASGANAVTLTTA